MKLKFTMAPLLAALLYATILNSVNGADGKNVKVDVRKGRIEAPLERTLAKELAPPPRVLLR